MGEALTGVEHVAGSGRSRIGDDHLGFVPSSGSVVLLASMAAAGDVTGFLSQMIGAITDLEVDAPGDFGMAGWDRDGNVHVVIRGSVQAEIYPHDEPPFRIMADGLSTWLEQRYRGIAAVALTVEGVDRSRDPMVSRTRKLTADWVRVMLPTIPAETPVEEFLGDGSEPSPDDVSDAAIGTSDAAIGTEEIRLADAVAETVQSPETEAVDTSAGDAEECRGEPEPSPESGGADEPPDSGQPEISETWPPPPTPADSDLARAMVDALGLTTAADQVEEIVRDLEASESGSSAPSAERGAVDAPSVSPDRADPSSAAGDPVGTETESSSGPKLRSTLRRPEHIGEPPSRVGTMPSPEASMGKRVRGTIGRRVPAPTPQPVPPATPVPAAAARPAAPATSPSPDAVIVHAVRCPSTHPNPPHSSRCRVCDREITDRSPVEIPRPPLGRLILPNGHELVLDRPMLIGRNPTELGGTPAGEVHELVTVSDPAPGLSRTHVEVRIEDWQVQIVDRDSRNGTFVEIAGRPPLRLRPGDPFPIPSDTMIRLGPEYMISFSAGVPG